MNLALTAKKTESIAFCFFVPEKCSITNETLASNAIIPDQAIHNHRSKRRDGYGDRHCSLVILPVICISFDTIMNCKDLFLK